MRNRVRMDYARNVVLLGGLPTKRRVSDIMPGQAALSVPVAGSLGHFGVASIRSHFSFSRHSWIAAYDAYTPNPREALCVRIFSHAPLIKFRSRNA